MDNRELHDKAREFDSRLATLADDIGKAAGDADRAMLDNDLIIDLYALSAKLWECRAASVHIKDKLAYALERWPQA
jgi:hypothetical protein